MDMNLKRSELLKILRILKNVLKSNLLKDNFDIMYTIILLSRQLYMEAKSGH
jgi:hypothetical protein